MNKYIALILALILAACSNNNKKPESHYHHSQEEKFTDSLHYFKEKHLKNIRQLTFGGNNAEAYFSFDNSKLIFQSDWDKINPQGCDQIFIMNWQENPPKYKLVSTGKGRTTCSYFLKDGKHIVYASTHEYDEKCPETKMFHEGKYVWPLYEYDIYLADTSGKIIKPLVKRPGYDAEATISPDGKYMIYTSDKSGDLELYKYNLETGEEVQLTNELGYDGGAFFSFDGEYIVWRASRPKGKDTTAYKELLKQHLVQPTQMQVFVMKADGSEKKQITNLPGANWAPFFHPSGKKIIFASNHHTQDKGGRQFNLFMINIDGTGLEQITYGKIFDAFPMFSYDGKYLVFSSNRQGKTREETNVFIAEWVE